MVPQYQKEVAATRLAFPQIDRSSRIIVAIRKIRGERRWRKEHADCLFFPTDGATFVIARAAQLKPAGNSFARKLRGFDSSSASIPESCSFSRWIWRLIKSCAGEWRAATLAWEKSCWCATRLWAMRFLTSWTFVVISSNSQRMM